MLYRDTGMSTHLSVSVLGKEVRVFSPLSRDQQQGKARLEPATLAKRHLYLQEFTYKA